MKIDGCNLPHAKFKIHSDKNNTHVRIDMTFLNTIKGI